MGGSGRRLESPSLGGIARRVLQDQPKVTFSRETKGPESSLIQSEDIRGAESFGKKNKRSIGKVHRSIAIPGHQRDRCVESILGKRFIDRDQALSQKSSQCLGTTRKRLQHMKSFRDDRAGGHEFPEQRSPSRPDQTVGWVLAIEQGNQRAGIYDINQRLHFARQLLRWIASRNESFSLDADGLDSMQPINSLARSAKETCSNSRANSSRIKSDSDF